MRLIGRDDNLDQSIDDDNNNNRQSWLLLSSTNVQILTLMQDTILGSIVYKPGCHLNKIKACVAGNRRYIYAHIALYIMVKSYKLPRSTVKQNSEI